jgi:hypothetical protein
MKRLALLSVSKAAHYTLKTALDKNPLKYNVL